jgi:hypothetical protein
VGNEEHVHVALPKLYGAPAYARPQVVPVQRAERPFDPDELPLEAVQTEEEREIARELTGKPYEGGAAAAPVFASREGSPMLRGRPFRLQALTGRFGGKRNGERNGS